MPTMWKSPTTTRTTHAATKIGPGSSRGNLAGRIPPAPEPEPVPTGERPNRASAPHQRDRARHPRRHGGHGAAAGALLQYVGAVLAELAGSLRSGDAERSAWRASAAPGAPTSRDCL